jgi:hypothetical protein
MDARLGPDGADPGPPRLGTSRETLDDVDRLFGRLSQLPAPRGLTAAVLLAAAQARPLRVSTRWLLAVLAGLAAVLALAYWTGQAMVGGGLLDLASAIAFGEVDLLGALPEETLLALLDAVPWLELLGAAAVLATLLAALRRLGVMPEGPAAGRAGAARPGGS